MNVLSGIMLCSCAAFSYGLMVGGLSSPTGGKRELGAMSMLGLEGGDTGSEKTGGKTFAHLGMTGGAIGVSNMADVLMGETDEEDEQFTGLMHMLGLDRGWEAGNPILYQISRMDMCRKTPSHIGGSTAGTCNPDDCNKSKKGYDVSCYKNKCCCETWRCTES